MTDDWDDLKRARQGDESAWRELIGRHQARLTAMALMITNCPAAARDIVQETFVRLLGAHVRNTEGSVGGFLATIAYRLAVKETRRRQRLQDVELLNPSDPTPSPLDDVLLQERDRHVAAAIRQLDSLHRDTLVLRFYGGHRYEEIARLTGVPLGTVKSRLFHAVKLCQKTLRDQGILE